MSASRKLWTLFLWLEGFFITSVALFVEFLRKHQVVTDSTATQVLTFSIGGALLCFFMAGILAFQNSRERKILRKLELKKTPPIDLQDCFRAAKAFGSQNPIFKDKHLQSEVFSIESRKIFNSDNSPQLGKPCRLVIEHWDGPDLQVEDGQRVFLVSPRSLLKLDLYERSQLKFSLRKKSLTDRSRAEGVIHYLPLTEG